MWCEMVDVVGEIQGSLSLTVPRNAGVRLGLEAQQSVGHAGNQQVNANPGTDSVSCLTTLALLTMTLINGNILRASYIG